LGSLTGIDIPDEKPGVLPSQAWKHRRYAKYGREHQKWYAGETISVGVGQGYNRYSPLQMALATATIANDGKRMRPRVLRAVIDNHGQRQELPPELINEVSGNPEFLAAVQRAMEETNRAGTAARSFSNAPYRSGGKTGTAQVYSVKKGQKYDKNDESLRDHSWFIAYAYPPPGPGQQKTESSGKPTIAVAVFVENGGPGSVSAAPIARQVFDAYLLEKRVNKPAPEDTESGAEDDGGNDRQDDGMHVGDGENAG